MKSNELAVAAEALNRTEREFGWRARVSGDALVERMTRAIGGEAEEVKFAAFV